MTGKHVKKKFKVVDSFTNSITFYSLIVKSGNHRQVSDFFPHKSSKT